MTYVQFYQKSAISSELIEACGDRSVIMYDGRISPSMIHDDAMRECKKRGYLAWRIFKGQSFTTSRPTSDIKFI